MAEETMSKSARQRAAKKARDAAVAAEATPAVAAPKASPKASPKAAPKAEPKVEPAAKAKAKAQPSPAAAAPVKCSCGAVFAADGVFCNKCGTKRPAAGGAAATPKAEPKKVEAKGAPKAEAKAGAKAEAKKAAKAKGAAAPAPVVPKDNLASFSYEDDGTGGDWEKSDGKTKKQTKQKAKKEADAEPVAVAKPAAGDSKPAAKSKAKASTEPVITSGMTPGQIMIAKIEAEATAKAHLAAEARIAAKGSGKGKGKDGEEVEAKVVDPNWITLSFAVPGDKVSRIIGPKGATLKMITEKTGVERIDTQNELCTILGLPDAVKACEVAIKEIVEKGYMSLAFDNFAEASVMVHPVNFPALIGAKGAIIRKIKEVLNVEINIPQGVSKDASGSWGKKKYPVSIAGSKDNVESAKEVVNDIVLYTHHKITHEGQVHEEMEIEESYYRFIIGQKGSEMRHIQNSFHVAVNIPRENNKDTGACEKLLIIGEPENVEKAKKYIESLIVKADSEPKRAPREDAPMDDPRNKDDELDPEAAQYLYKRKQ